MVSRLVELIHLCFKNFSFHPVNQAGFELEPLWVLLVTWYTCMLLHTHLVFQFTGSKLSVSVPFCESIRDSLKGTKTTLNL